MERLATAWLHAACMQMLARFMMHRVQGATCVTLCPPLRLPQLGGTAFRPARHTGRHPHCLPTMSDFELAKLRALGDTTPPGDRTPELEALVGFATTMGDAETLIKAAAARCKQQSDGAVVEQLEPDVFEASGA